MPEFAVFVVDDQGPLYRGSYDLETAKEIAKELAAKEGFEFFVYSFQSRSEIARFQPSLPGSDSGENIQA
jgi:hypothetical protein